MTSMAMMGPDKDSNKIAQGGFGAAAAILICSSSISPPPPSAVAPSISDAVTDLVKEVVRSLIGDQGSYLKVILVVGSECFVECSLSTG